MQIEPQQTLPLVYNTTDPYDSTVYYVRAVVSDSLTRTVLQTVDLVSRGNGRYDQNITAPADPSGNGRHVDVVISVYTDSGYTTYSDVYARQIDKYFVKRLPTSGMFGGGSGGGSDIDYEKIRKIFIEAVSNIKPFDPTLITELLLKVDAKIRKIMDKKPQEVKDADFTPILTQIANTGVAIMDSVKSIEIPPPAKLDLSPVLEQLAAFAAKLEDSSASGKEELTKEFGDLREAVFKEIAKNSKNVITEHRRSEKIRQIEQLKKIINEIDSSETDEDPPERKPKNNPLLSKYFTPISK